MQKTLLVLAVLALAVGLAAGGVSLVRAKAEMGYLPTSAASYAEEEAICYLPEERGIWVSGEGKVTVVPDVAILSLGVEAQAATVEGAIAEAAVAMDRVIAALRANGVEERDIKTQCFDIYPVRHWTENGVEVLIGYRVSNIVSAKIRDVEATGRIIDRVAEAGGDLTRINGVSFTVDDPSQYYAQARDEAVADAQAKAQHLAQLAGVELGRPFYIAESGGFVPIYRDYGMVEAVTVPPTPIEPGETEVTLSVQMAFAIE